MFLPISSISLASNLSCLSPISLKYVFEENLKGGTRKKDKGEGQERREGYLSNLASTDIFLTSLQFVFPYLFLPFYYYTNYWVSNIAENRTPLDKWPIKQGHSTLEWSKRERRTRSLFWRLCTSCGKQRRMSSNGK